MPSPEQMRAAVAGYVQEIHRAYVDQAMTFPPGVRGRMPLLGGRPFTVAAVATRNLHLLATDRVARPAARSRRSRSTREFRGVELAAALLRPRGRARRWRWSTRPTGRPSPTCAARSASAPSLYHFVAEPGAGLSGAPRRARRHRAGQRPLLGGARLRDDPLPGARDARSSSTRWPAPPSPGCRTRKRCWRKAIAPHDAGVLEACDAQPPDPDAIRKALLAGRRRTQRSGRRER